MGDSITQSDFEQWLNEPVTQKLMHKLMTVKMEAMQAWAQEAYVGVDAYDSERKTAKAIGAISIIDQLLGLSNIGDLM